MVEKPLTLADAFPKTLNKLEGLINYLEKSTGTAHRSSPFEKPGKSVESKAPKEGTNKCEGSKDMKKAPQQQQELKEKPAPKKMEENDKKEKQEKKKPGPPKEEVEDFFAQIEIRVGKIVEVWKV